jgi:hypothetical protein
MIEMLFKLFIWNNNKELRKIIIISSPSQNSKIIDILMSSKHILMWTQKHDTERLPNNPI